MRPAVQKEKGYMKQVLKRHISAMNNELGVSFIIQLTLTQKLEFLFRNSSSLNACFINSQARKLYFLENLKLRLLTFL